jgi:hypothetical protein
MRDKQNGEQNKREIESNVEHESACEQLVFAERELPLYRDPWHVEQVRNWKTTL